MKRLAVFFHFDSKGVVGEFVFDYLKALRTCVDSIVFVNNGEIEEASRSKVANTVDNLIVRQNYGFDSWAYKEAIDRLGWKRIREYDELILCNFTCYASTDAISSMFREMEARDCDFWGVAKHPEYDHFLIPEENAGYIHEHIMSYFMVFKRPVLESEIFVSYWESLPEIRSYADAVGRHETVLTRYLESYGFKSDSLIDLNETRKVSSNASVYQADDFLDRFGCGLVKRKAFFHEYQDFVRQSNGRQGSSLIASMSLLPAFNLNAIWEDLLRTQSMYSLIENLHLTYTHKCIPRGEAQVSASLRHPLVYWIYVETIDVAQFLETWMSPLPSDAKIYLQFSSISLRHRYFDRINEKLSGRAIDASKGEHGKNWIFALRDAISASKGSDLLCFIALDPPPSSAKWLLPYHHAYRDCLLNLVEGKDYAWSIRTIFGANPKLGLLLPLLSTHAEFNPLGIPVEGSELSRIGDICRELEVPHLFTELYAEKCMVLPARSFWLRSGVIGTSDLDQIFPDWEQGQTVVAQAALPLISQSKGCFTGLLASEEALVGAHDNLRWKLKVQRSFPLQQSAGVSRMESEQYVGILGKEKKWARRPIILQRARKLVHSWRDAVRKFRRNGRPYET